MEKDWDIIISYWLKDIPYIWITPESENVDWKHCHRIYMIPQALLALFDQPSPHGHFFPNLRKSDSCKHVAQYFQVASPTFYIFSSAKKLLRINGRPAHLPEDIKTFHLYDYLGVSPPTEQVLREWKKLLIISQPTPHLLDVTLPDVAPATPIGNPPTTLKTRRAISELLWHIYIAKKYSHLCVPFTPTQLWSSIPYLLIESNVMEAFSLIVNIYDKDYKNILLMGIDRDDIGRCHNHDRILLQASLQFVWEKSAHANFFLFDKPKKQLYIFDPNGKSPNQDKFDKIIPKILRHLGFDSSGWNIIHSGDWCPRISFQRYGYWKKRQGDYGGFCASWTFWMMETILKNPSVPYEKLVRSAMQELAKNEPSFMNHIRRYTKQIEQYSEKVLKEMGIDDIRPGDLQKLRDYVDKM